MQTSFSNDFKDKQGVLKLMVGALSPRYHLPDNIMFASVGLVYINVQPRYELPRSTRFGQIQKFGKFEFGHCPPAIPKEKNMHGV